MNINQKLSNLSNISKENILAGINLLIGSKELQPYKNTVKIPRSISTDSIEFIYRELLDFNTHKKIISFESDTEVYFPLDQNQYEILLKYQKLLTNKSGVINSHGLQIDLEKEDISYGEITTTVTESQEMTLLKILAKNAGLPVSFSKIYEEIYGNEFPDDEYSRSQIREIKKRLRGVFITKMRIPEYIANEIVVSTKRQHYKLTITDT